MKVLVIGRSSKRRISGLSRITALYREQLLISGAEVSLVTGEVANAALWIDGNLDEDIQGIRAVSGAIPVVVIPTFRHDLPTMKKNVDELLRLNQQYGNIYFAVFHDLYRWEPALSVVKDRIVTLPHPLPAPLGNSVPFEDRAGVCLGHIDKIRIERYTNRRFLGDRFDTQEVVDMLADLGHEVFAYGEPSKDLPPLRKVTVIPYSPSLVEDTISHMKAVLSIQTTETFWMIPLEAQGVGTPVVYRHMPQSLSVYIGPTGLAVSTLQEARSCIKAITSDEKLWTGISESGRRNAEAMSYTSTWPITAYTFKELVK